jgi:hypothetical protein
MQTAAVRTSETNPAKLTRLYVDQFKLSAVSKGETVAVVSDLGTAQYVQSAFAAAELVPTSDSASIRCLVGRAWVCPRSANARDARGRVRRPDLIVFFRARSAAG